MMSRKNLIASYCELVNGRYVDGTFGKGPFMVKKYKAWEIIFDYYVVSTGQSVATYTRVRTAFINPDGYTLKLGKEGFLSKVGKAFGGQDIEIGDEIFDADQIIKSNDEITTRRLLNNFDIKSRINFNKSYSLDIIAKNSMGIKCEAGESGLIFYMIGTLKHDIEIINVLELFEFTLDALVDLNVTKEVLPKTVLYKEKHIE